MSENATLFSSAVICARLIAASASVDADKALRYSYFVKKQLEQIEKIKIKYFGMAEEQRMKLRLNNFLLN